MLHLSCCYVLSIIDVLRHMSFYLFFVFRHVQEKEPFTPGRQRFYHRKPLYTTFEREGKFGNGNTGKDRNPFDDGGFGQHDNPNPGFRTKNNF